MYTAYIHILNGYRLNYALTSSYFRTNLTIKSPYFLSPAPVPAPTASLLLLLLVLLYGIPKPLITILVPKPFTFSFFVSILYIVLFNNFRCIIHPSLRSVVVI